MYGDIRHCEANLSVICLYLLLVAFPLYPSSSTAGEIPVVRFTVAEFRVTGDNPLTAEETQQALKEFLGDHAGLDGLLAAADALEKSLSDKGYSFHRVSLPQQALKGGVVILEIIQFRIGKVILEGNELFSRENILAGIPPLEEGTTPNTRRLSRALALANEHPAKDLRLTFKESAEATAIDAHLEITEREPQQFFAALNNTGARETGRGRLSLGYQHGNLFDRDHSGTLVYTTSPEEPDKVEQYALNYEIPLYRYAGKLRLFASKSSVDSGRVADAFDVRGAGKVFGVRYTQNFLKLGKYRHKAVVGIDDKFFENDVDFFGDPAGGCTDEDIRSRPVSIRYEGEYPLRQGRAGFHIAHARNLGGGRENTKEAYANCNADQDWDVLRFGVNGDYYLPKGWLLRGRLEGQHSDEPLISGEQFGLGGANSVRGFDERVLAGDSGYLMSAELWSPLLPNDVRVLGFADWGSRKLRKPTATDDEKSRLASVGLGVRWSWKKKLGLRADLAKVVHGASATNRGPGFVKFHFSLFYRL